MSRKVDEIHARYYLQQFQAQPADWQGFDRKWPQIERAWQWVSQQSQDRQLVADYLHTFCPLLDRRGLWHEMLAWSQAAFEILTHSGNQADLPDLLLFQGDAYHNLGALELAQRTYERGLARVDPGQDRHRYCLILNKLGITLHRFGKTPQDRQMFEKVLSLCAAAADPRAEADALLGLGTIYEIEGDWTLSESHLSKALAILQRLDDRVNIAKVFSSLGSICEERGQFDQSLAMLAASLELRRQLGDKRGEAITLNNIGWVYFGK